MMKRVLSVAACMLLCLAAGAQNIVNDFVGTLKGRNATFAYVYSVAGDVPMTGKGTVQLQGDAFHMNGNGLDIWCDGKTRWTMDLTSDECYIETVDAQAADYSANPALLVGAIDKVFTVTKTAEQTVNGRKCKAASLKPIKGDTGFSGAVLILSGTTPLGVTLNMADGSTVTIKISDYKLSDEVPVKSFTYDTRKLSKKYVITDLR